jgi:hypothetical protein
MTLLTHTETEQYKRLDAHLEQNKDSVSCPLSTILIATITTSDIRSDSDGASIVAILSLPTSRSNARIKPFPTYCFIPSSSLPCSSGDFRNNFTYIINPRITDIAITTPTAISMPNVGDPTKGLSRSSGKDWTLKVLSVEKCST